MSNAATRYCEAYDRYQTTFALHRLAGWSGSHDSAPPAILERYEEMQQAFDALYQDTMSRPRPNYVELAQQLAKETEPAGGTNDE